MNIVSLLYLYTEEGCSFIGSKPLTASVSFHSQRVGQDVCRISKLVWFWLLWGVQSQQPKPQSEQGKPTPWCVSGEQQGLAAVQGEVTWDTSAGCKPSRAGPGVAMRFS